MYFPYLFQILAEIFQDLLANKDDYLRALRALFREIVRSLRHDLDFSAFALGLLQERTEAKFVDMEQAYKVCFNSLPNNRILDWSNLTAFADDKIDMNEKLKFGLGRVENIVGKGENAGNQLFTKHCGKRRKCWLPAFSPFPTMFSKAFFNRVIKAQVV